MEDSFNGSEVEIPDFYNDSDILRELRWFSYRVDFLSSVVFTLIALVGVIANGCVVIMVLCHGQLRTPMNFFITNLAAADLILLVVLIIPRDINFFTPLRIFSTRSSLLATQYIQHVCIQATSLILATMSFSRYTMVVFPLKAKAEWTSRRVWFCCAASWILSILIHIPILFGVLYTHKGGYNIYYIETSTKVFSLLKMLFIFILPFSVIVFCYSRIMVTFRKSRYKLKRNANLDSGEQAGGDDQTKRLARMVLIIILVFFLSWAPIQSYLTWLSCRLHTLPTTPTNWKLINVFGFVFRLSAYLGGATNPFIYAYTNPSFKKVGMFRIRKKTNLESTVNVTGSSQL